MGYFYIKPRNPQYFFPENFKKHVLFLSLFQSYNLKGKIFWLAWRNLSFLRKQYYLNSIERYVPEALIRKNLSGTPILAFNAGSAGPENKTTALGFLNDEYFFIKFAQTNIAKNNVLNEAKVLKKLQHLDFVPKVLKLKVDAEFTFLKTSVLFGERFTARKLDKELVSLLLKIVKLDVRSENNNNDTVKMAFAHGDFCPWNLMNNKGNIVVFDWEMAGIYPVGYDVFTYVFQTSFLLRPGISISQLITENESIITYYFKELKIANWSNFLISFAEIKMRSKIEKNNNRLITRYSELLDYAKKT